MTDTQQLEGWIKWGGEEPFEDHVRPFFMKMIRMAVSIYLLLSAKSAISMAVTFCMAAC